MKQVLAVAVACLLIAGALLVRSAIDGDDEDKDDDPGGEPGGDDDGLVIACIPELRAACEALDRPVSDLRIEDPGVTIADPDVDAWVTFDPWPAIAGEPRFADVEPVAVDDLVVLAQERSVPPACDELTWTCLVDELGNDDVAVPEPSTALGRLVLGHAAADLFGSATLASNDFGDPDFARRMRKLAIGGDPLDDILVGLPKPVATGGLALTSLGTRPVTSGPGDPAATVAVVVAGPERDRVAGEPSFTEALRELGWTVDAEAATTGLPNPGVLVALTEDFG